MTAHEGAYGEECVPGYLLQLAIKYYRPHDGRNVKKVDYRVSNVAFVDNEGGKSGLIWNMGRVEVTVRMPSSVVWG